VEVVDGVNDVEKLAGRDLGFSEWRSFSQHDVDAFAQVTGDFQWIHADGERSHSGPFGGPIVHGFLVLSMIPVLRAEVLAVRGVRLVMNYGLDRVRFLAPLRVGARFRVAFSVVGLEDHRAGRRIVFRSEFQNAEGETICVADSISVVVPAD
jgi:acyl dehydratase